MDLDHTRMDWKELRDQKLCLLEAMDIIGKISYLPVLIESLRGILHLIDHIQDEVVAQGYLSEEEVCGQQKAEKGE